MWSSFLPSITIELTLATPQINKKWLSDYNLEQSHGFSPVVKETQTLDTTQISPTSAHKTDFFSDESGFMFWLQCTDKKQVVSQIWSTR